MVSEAMDIEFEVHVCAPPNSPASGAYRIDMTTFLDRVVSALPSHGTGSSSSRSRCFCLCPVPRPFQHMSPAPYDPGPDVTPAGITNPEHLLYLCRSPLSNSSSHDYPYRYPVPGPDPEFVRFPLGAPPPAMLDTYQAPPVQLSDPPDTLLVGLYFEC